MNVLFSKYIGQTLELYIDDMIVKKQEGESHAANSKDILEPIRRYNMHLKYFKFSFGM